MSSLASIAVPADLPDASADESAAGEDADRLAACVARAERRLRILDEITEIGMRLMRKLDEPVPAAEASDDQTPAHKEPRVDPATAFAKLSRALRLTLELETRTEAALRAALAGEVATQAARREARRQSANRAEGRRQEEASIRVETQVGHAIARETETESEYVERHAALDERLEFDEAYEDLADRPLRAVVEQLCGDLGLTPDWSDWTEDGWPEPPEPVGPAARGRFSPFHRPSPRPILWRNRDYAERPPGILELAKPPP